MFGKLFKYNIISNRLVKNENISKSLIVESKIVIMRRYFVISKIIIIILDSDLKTFSFVLRTLSVETGTVGMTTLFSTVHLPP